MKIAIAILLLIIAVFFGRVMLSPPADNLSGRSVEGLPWQVETLPDGNSRVSGVIVGATTLGDVCGRFGSDAEVALIAAPGEPGGVEAYFPDVTLGAVTGKLVATADIDAAKIEPMRQRAVKVEYMESTTKKWTLAPDDLAAAKAAPIRALTFIPAVNLDEQVVLQRFGPPAERLRVSDHAEHFLYPQRGLDLILDTEGKEVLQYVPPRRFAELRAPLAAKRRGVGE